MLHHARAPWIFAALVASGLTACGDGSVEGLAGVDTTKSESNFDVSGVQMGVTSGVSGTIWTLAAYDDGTPHPGENAIDIGAPGGTGVWHQVNGLPAEVGGGWIYVDWVKEAGYCSGFNPGDASYNGAKLRVYTYFYGTDGTYLGHNAAVYQHVVLADGVQNAWLSWNNPKAGAMWATPHATLGNGGEGGVYLGTLFAGGGKKILNTNGKLCHWGDHLHQENRGARAALSLDQSVSGRADDAHVFYANTSVPAPGNPPEAPPAVGSGNPVPQDPPVDPQDPPVDPASCACKAGVDNFCQYGAGTAGCAMTFPGGYCDPDGNGDYADADWVTGWYDFAEKCGAPQPPPEDPPPPPPPSTCPCKAGVDNFCNYGPTEGCAMTLPGGYCDPNGDASYSDADWVQGWYDFKAQCGG